MGVPIYHHNTTHCRPGNYEGGDEISPCTSNMILSAFLARIREMSSNRGVVSAVSSLAVAFGSAHGYCKGVKNIAQISERIDRDRSSHLLAGTDAKKKPCAIRTAVAMSARYLLSRKQLHTFWRYSYATRVNPNWGLLRMIRAGPPFQRALKPSSRSGRVAGIETSD